MGLNGIPILEKIKSIGYLLVIILEEIFGAIKAIGKINQIT